MHEKYVKRGSSIFGPYYYKTYRDKDGNVKTEYIGKKDMPEKSSFSIFLVVVLLIISLIGINLVKDYTGYSTLDESILEPVINQNLNETTEPSLEINGIDNLKNLYPEYTINKNGDKLEIKKRGFRMELDGADPKDIKNLKFNNTLVHLDSLPLENATIEIEHEPIKGVVSKSKLYKCEDSNFNLETLECSEWELTNIPVETTNTIYRYIVSHFTTYNVGAGGDYTGISACLFAVNNTANDCDLIDANTNYVVNSTFSNGVEFLINNSDNEVIKITNNNITFDCNLTKITGNTTGTFLRMFVSGKSTNNVTVKNCQINNYQDGIDANVAGYNISIINNTFINITSSAIHKGGGGSSHLNFTSIQNNTIFCNQPGIAPSGSIGINMLVFNGNLTIAYNKINNCSVGMRLGTTNSSIYNNTINMSGAHSGIYLCGGLAGCSLSGNNYIWNNNFTNSSVMTTGFYAREDSAPAAPNFFNNSGIGNYWPDIRSLRIFDTNADGYGDAGKQYPYNNSKGATYVSNVTDWAPGNVKSCTTPADELFLNNDTLFCGGRYQINDVDANGLVYINSSNIDVDGYNSSLIGNESGIGINFTGYMNVNITNVNFSKYQNQIYLVNTNFSTIRDSYFYIHQSITGKTLTGIDMESGGAGNFNLTILNNSFSYVNPISSGVNYLRLQSSVWNSSIENNTFKGDTYQINVEGGGGAGKGLVFRGNRFSDVKGAGLYAVRFHSISEGGPDSIILNNTFINASAIDIEITNNTLIVDNMIYNTTIGIALTSAFSSNIQNNTLINCSGYCITLIDAVNNTLVYNNTIKEGIFGIDLGLTTKAENNKIYNNTLLNNPTGIRITSGSNNTFWNNNVTNTTTISYYANVSVAGNYFNLSTGNYWGNIRSLSIFDANGNGIGDSGGDYPYSNTSTNPLVIGYIQDYAPYTSLNDTTNPSVTLTIGSTSLSLTQTTSITCSGTDSGGMQSAIVSVTGANAGSGDCSGTSSCSGTYTGSFSGTSTVTCTTKDLLNNQASTSSTITVTESAGTGGGDGGGTSDETVSETPTTPVTPVEETPIIIEQPPIVQELVQDLILNIPTIPIENVISTITEDKAEIQLDDKAIMSISYYDEGEGRPKPRLSTRFNLIPKMEEKEEKIVKPFRFKDIYIALSFPLWLLWILLLIQKAGDKLSHLR